MIQVEAVEVREVFIEIMPIGDETRVVTLIEVFSYANKAAGSEGRELYLTKQQELLQSRVNLIEIDLLRRSDHTLAVPRAHSALSERWDYLICLHRSGQRGRFETWRRTVRERLPRIHVPLENDLPDVILDLQTVFDRNYEEGAYVRRIDYRREPPMPLRNEDSTWATNLLLQHGVNP